VTSFDSGMLCTSSLLVLGWLYGISEKKFSYQHFAIASASLAGRRTALVVDGESGWHK